MVSHQAINTFVVSDGIPGPKLHDNLLGGVARDGASDLIEVEDIGISEELEIRV
jgi:hypothetical protein